MLAPLPPRPVLLRAASTPHATPARRPSCRLAARSRWLRFLFLVAVFQTCRDVLAPAAAQPSPSRNLLQPHPAAEANLHPPGVVDRPELVPFIVADPQSLPGVVVDETQATLVGAWQYSTHTPPYVGLGYLHDKRGGKGAKSVTFTPELPRAGWYEVRLAHCYNVRRATNAPVTIRHADGETLMRINQQEEPSGGRLWRTLGTFRFVAGKAGFVRIGNDATEGKYVITDAVQFLPVSAPAPAAAAHPTPPPPAKKP